MKRLTLLVVAVAAIWAGWWFLQAQQTRSAVDGWFADRRAEGWTAEYADLSVRGFPNRVDVTLTEPRLVDPESGFRWQAPFLQSLRLVYKPGHHIVAFPETMTLGQTLIEAEGLRASIVEEDGIIARANAEAVVLNLAGPERSVALAGVTAALSTVPGLPDTYRIGLSADAVAGQDRPGPSQGAADGLDVQAEIRFDRPWRLAEAAAQRPQPTAIDLRLMQYQVDAVLLKLAGTLTVDAAGRGDGELMLRAENWRSLLDQAREGGQLPQALADAIEEGLALYSRLTGNGQALDVTLRFDEGRVMLGPIPLGEGPLLRLP
ncbi:DUF2125 domain-containing protein [Thetidibacter halocola]|uniref:DUF2125 domain-containing protein n=1 Tax=Thetidibacter halocola TaxID=2827239 RepID=A0A8J7WCC8_9RHOB|nr:DUF2125 domain-containing protein [Thetidibacter halocola]MBS0123824.1 DUF2125 domain-containing protein [Thetidibacter halocola]